MSDSTLNIGETTTMAGGRALVNGRNNDVDLSRLPTAICNEHILVKH